MEDLLKKIELRPPRQGLRVRLLGSIDAEIGEKSRLSNRIWSSRVFWLSAAGAVVLGLLLPCFVTDLGVQNAAPSRPSPDAESMAKELSSLIGDGTALQRKFETQLTGPIDVFGGGENTIKDSIQRGT